MSFIKGDKKEIVSQIVYEINGIQCDICSKVIRKPIHPERWFDKAFKYYIVQTHHNDWGNDSVESFEAFHVCPECINQFVADYLNRDQKTGCIDIETCHVYGDMKITE